MTTTRRLPPEEYHRLAGLDIAGFLPYAAGADSAVIVVEDGDRIVGVWGAFRVVHLEGVWVAPEYRHRPRVIASLLRETVAAAREWSLWAFTGAASEPVRKLVTRLGGVSVPMDTYALSLEREGRSCQPRS